MLYIKYYIVTLLLLINILSYSQVGNDDCANATPLGNLPNPANCGNGPNNNGQGAPAVFNNLTNVNSLTEFPYTTLINCQGTPGNNMASPSTDVWYSFVPTGNSLDITITGNINQPNIGIWTGNCGALIGAGCDVGGGGNLNTTVAQVTPGQTYYIQVSGGNPTDQGTFNLTLQNNNSCDDCLLSSNMTVTPLPTNGVYQAGTTVTFCFTITEWSQENQNWFHGIVPIMGAGWGAITPISAATTCDGGPGVWGWFNGVNTPNGNSNGFFFDGDLFQFPNGNPSGNYGDNCDGNVNWEFCWEATAIDCPPGQDGDDLSVFVETYADGETGSWINIACQNDPIFAFAASLTCCPTPTETHTDEICLGDNNGTITVTGQGSAPWDYTWFDSNGNTIQTSNNVNGSDNMTGLAPGVYDVSVIDNDGCTQSIQIIILPGGQVSIVGIFHN
tara:strand:+ start:379 stop:1713 length:1335 start_codon:yes stop_codon:yes gene_type:complete